MKKHVVSVFVLLLAVFQMHGQIPKGSKILTGGLNGNGYVVSGNNSYFFGPSIGGNVFIRENVSLGIGSGAAMSFGRSGNVRNTGVSVPLTFSIQKWMIGINRYDAQSFCSTILYCYRDARQLHPIYKPHSF